ncbi:MAG TPA: hypothetical protein VLA12_01180, partial [Planctomycetaceae bacterium]|nr:hypothetical protein [Planctomycetaceae bacterium]
QTVNLETDLAEDEILESIWEKNQSDSLPHLVLQSPPKWGPPQTVWSGELTIANTEPLTDSPARKQIVKRLISGDSVVWVLLESGDKQKDDLAFELLNAEIALLQAKLKLPEIDKQDLADLSVAPESLKISFSAVRVSKDDAAEGPFVEMLLGVEPDLRDKDFINQPMVFPVFGRGRALYALVGDGIAADLIEEAGQFLTGACQCTVKRDNPGVDLLMSVDWDRFVEPTEALDASLPPLAGFSGFGGEITPASEDRGANAEIVGQQSSSANPSETPDDSIETAQVTSADSTDAVTVVDQGGKNPETPGENLLGRNLKFVLLLVVGAVVIATLFLKPRAT